MSLKLLLDLVHLTHLVIKGAESFSKERETSKRAQNMHERELRESNPVEEIELEDEEESIASFPTIVDEGVVEVVIVAGPEARSAPAKKTATKIMAKKAAAKKAPAKKAATKKAPANKAFSFKKTAKKAVKVSVVKKNGSKVVAKNAKAGRSTFKPTKRIGPLAVKKAAKKARTIKK